MGMAQKLNVADLKLSSPAFAGHSRMPDKHTSNGEDVAPPLEWTGVPDGTKSFAVVVHDPDAPLVDGFTHWVAYNIPGDAAGLPRAEAMPRRAPTRSATRATTGPRRRRDTGAITTTSGSTRSTTTSASSLGSTGAHCLRGSRTT
jgi:phosphatidylethanolamine-binding protein (PEBP) family uncharacterized protein